MKLDFLKHSLKYDDLIKSYNGKWRDIARHKYLPFDFIDEYFFKLKPFNIQFFQILSPYLMFKYGDNLNWKVISKTQNIPEILIRKYQDKVNWWYISEYQQMNDQFIREFIDKLKIDKLKINRNLQGRLILLELN